jgi:Methylamine utilization protein MauJ/SEC-C motif
MSKMGRNDPCFCGSGKKYKKCHALVPISETDKSPATLVARLPKDASSLEMPLLGIPGVFYYVTMRPRFTGQNDPRNSGGIQGLPGLYKAVFTLSRPGFSLQPERATNMGGDLLQGDSHLIILAQQSTVPTEVEIEIGAKHGNFTFRVIPNEKGFVGRVQIDSLQAKDFRDAELKAHQTLAPILSDLSAFLDIPLHIHQVDIKELRTETVQTNTISPFSEITVAGNIFRPINPDYRRYASFYREAVNCNSPNYQFLCFYKIIDGLRKRRDRRIEKLRQRGETLPPQAEEVIPILPKDQEEWINSLFPVKKKVDEIDLTAICPKESLGRKIKDITGKELKTIRDQIAHAILMDNKEEKEIISIDDGVASRKVHKWLPLTKCISRHLMMKEFPDVFQITGKRSGSALT